MQNVQERWLLCPVCNHKTRIILVNAFNCRFRLWNADAFTRYTVPDAEKKYLSMWICKDAVADKVSVCRKDWTAAINITACQLTEHGAVTGVSGNPLGRLCNNCGKPRRNVPGRNSPILPQWK